MSNPDLAIEIKGVNKYFKKIPKRVVALEGINLEVKKGDVFGFVGPNGAGKTTLIKLMMGMLHPDGGEVTVMGGSPFDRESKRHLGYLPERPYFYDFLTGEEFLSFHGKLFNLNKKFLTKRIPEVLEMVGLVKGRYLELKKYSKGMLQRIGLAQALLHDPEILVLDEPMSGLDPLGRREVRELIQSVAQMGKTVFFSTHIMVDVETICTNVGLINHGKLKYVPDLDVALGKTIHAIEVKFFHPKDKQVPKGLGAKEKADGWVYELKVRKKRESYEEIEQQLNEYVKKLIDAGCYIKSIIPRKSGLEELFFEETK